ncbi:trehalose-6-phosphate synthase [SAR202 cluster bacterium AD-802-F09_MRT_200m]|nr:trehalose-6-phosphate synthase [SAR202 cluster bacterium AD-802-F09_MRT_200m]
MADAAELNDLCAAVLAKRPLILVSNRGPVEHQISGDGRPEARRGSGSVVTAFSSLAQNFEFTWVASAMGEGDRVVSNSGQSPHLRSPLPGHQINLRYVVTPRRAYHKYYNIICNPLLWFLQHYMWNPPYNPNVDAAVHDAWEGGYIPVNQAFADAVIEEARGLEEAPIIIGHDYHLYLMPEFVRQRVPEAIIQHYVHIPWPTPQYWRMIPDYITRRICESLCVTDLLGFQTINDARCFLDTAEEFVPSVTVDRVNHTVSHHGRTTSVKVYPISINVAEVQRIANTPRALDYEARLSDDTGEVTIVRIDRAEPNKNVVRGFRAYELLLNRYPEIKGKVKFLAFLVPSRTHIRQYQRYMDEIQQVIQQINNNHGTLDWQPIIPFIENNYTQAIAGMKIYDVLLVNTIIEGMNLVAKEGPVVNTRDGVLVLSHSSGVFRQMASGAISVSPTDIEGTMEALHQAITMSAEDRKERAARMLESVCREDINHWLYQQLHDISDIL